MRAASWEGPCADSRPRRRVVAAVLTLGVTPAGAISYGTLDGTAHPNVGALVVALPDGQRADLLGHARRAEGLPHRRALRVRRPRDAAARGHVRPDRHPDVHDLPRPPGDQPRVHRLQGQGRRVATRTTWRCSCSTPRPSGITPAAVAPVGYLDRASLKGTKVLSVGYGTDPRHPARRARRASSTTPTAGRAPARSSRSRPRGCARR